MLGGCVWIRQQRELCHAVYSDHMCGRGDFIVIALCQGM